MLGLTIPKFFKRFLLAENQQSLRDSSWIISCEINLWEITYPTQINNVRCCVREGINGQRVGMRENGQDAKRA